MTEKTNITETPGSAWTATVFLLSLIGAPLAIGGFGFALARAGADNGVIVAASAAFGAPSYLLVGAPAFLYAVSHGSRSVPAYAGLGFAANLVAMPLMGLALMSDGDDLARAWETALFIGAFGLFFAPIYGAVFGLTFHALTWLKPLAPPRAAVEASALFRLLAACAVAAYLVAGLAVLAQSGAEGAELGELWAETLNEAAPAAMAALPLYIVLWLAGRTSLIACAVAGALMQGVFVTWRLWDAPSPSFEPTPMTLTAVLFTLLLLRLLLGASWPRPSRRTAS